MSQGVSLETIARQLERVLDRIGAIDDQLAGLIGMASRREATLTELAVEFRGLSLQCKRSAPRGRGMQFSAKTFVKLDTRIQKRFATPTHGL